MSTVLTTPEEVAAYFAESDNTLYGCAPAMASSRIEFAEGGPGQHPVLR